MVAYRSVSTFVPIYPYAAVRSEDTEDTETRGIRRTRRRDVMEPRTEEREDMEDGASMEPRRRRVVPGWVCCLKIKSNRILIIPWHSVPIICPWHAAVVYVCLVAHGVLYHTFLYPHSDTGWSKSIPVCPYVLTSVLPYFRLSSHPGCTPRTPQTITPHLSIPILPHPYCPNPIRLIPYTLYPIPYTLYPIPPHPIPHIRTRYTEQYGSNTPNRPIGILRICW